MTYRATPRLQYLGQAYHPSIEIIAESLQGARDKLINYYDMSYGWTLEKVWTS